MAINLGVEGEVTARLATVQVRGRLRQADVTARLVELDARVVGEALACRLEHDLGEVKTHAKHLAAIDPEKGEQAAVVEDPPASRGT